jgi:hypothetical protein
MFIYRLLRYNPKTKNNEVLIDGLHFANGVVLSPKEDFVLVAESIRSRIHRYYLKGPKKGSWDIFIDGLPGLPDNLKSDGQGGFLVPLVVFRDKNNPVLFQSLGPFPLLRKFIARVLALLEMPFEQIDKIYPNSYTKSIVHWIGHFESLNGLGQKGSVILQLDVDGKIKHSYHNTDGSLSAISEAHWFDGAFYLGSPYNTYVGRVKLSFAEPQESKQEQKLKPQKEQQSRPQHQKQPPPPQHEQHKPPPQQQQQKTSQQQQQQQNPPPAQQQQEQQKPPQPQQQQQKPTQQQKPPSQQQQQQQQQKPPSPPQQQQQQNSPPPQQQQQQQNSPPSQQQPPPPQ